MLPRVVLNSWVKRSSHLSLPPECWDCRLAPPSGSTSTVKSSVVLGWRGYTLFHRMCARNKELLNSLETYELNFQVTVFLERKYDLGVELTVFSFVVKKVVSPFAESFTPLLVALCIFLCIFCPSDMV